MATLDRPAPVNLVRSIFLCNIFNFFFSASKACLIPFLSVYLKMLGLTATQTGIIISAKTVVSLVFAPLWARCAVRFGRRRCMLMFSLFMMSVAYLSLTAVPSIDEQAFASRCKPHLNEQAIDLSQVMPPKNGNPVSSTSSPDIKTTPSKKINSTEQLESNQNTTSSIIESVDNISTKAPVTKEPKPDQMSTDKNSDITKSKIAISTEKITESNTVFISTTPSEGSQRVIAILTQVLKEAGVPEEQLIGASKTELEDTMIKLLNTEKGSELVSDALKDMPEDFTDDLLQIMGEEEASENRQKRESDKTESESEEKDSKLDSWKNLIYQKVKDIRQNIRETKDKVFAVVLVILMVGEMFCAPVEKIADDGWFEFLESIDDMEKYGMQRIWSTFAYILLPLIVTLAVDNSKCVFGMSIHPFMLHFLFFGIMLGAAFIISFYYPLVISDKFRYATKVGKGIRIVCCNGRSFMFVITLLVLGSLYASYYNFLFWQLLDMGSKEITLGLCLTMAALSEIPMLLFSEKLVEKIGSGGVVSISLLLVGGRCLYYSFLPTPWAVIPAELTHALTHTAMWWAILSSPTFNTSPALSRSIRSILSTVYFGVGFASGSFIAGVVYDTYGPTILFQAGAVLAFCWFPFICIGVRCCREKNKSEVKYTRLLAADDASDTDSIEDDWLEQALKDK